MQCSVAVRGGWPAAVSSGRVRRACLTIRISFIQLAMLLFLSARHFMQKTNLGDALGDALAVLSGSWPAGFCVD